jgi:hypothetical protein
LYNSAPIDQIKGIISPFVDSIIFRDNYVAYKAVDVTATCNSLNEIAKNDEIMSITYWIPPQPTLFNSRELTGVNRLQSGILNPVNIPTPNWMTNVFFTGDSIWFNNSENSGTFRHLDFFEFNRRDTVFRDTSRTKFTWQNLPSSPYFTYHGIMTAATAIGNGWASTSSLNFPTTDLLHWRGVAPKAMIIPGNLTGDVNNLSFTEGGNYYLPTSSTNDIITSHHEGGGSPANNNVIVTGPGNNAGEIPQYGPQNGYLSILANSKNTINSGAAGKYGPELIRAEFSGIGPTRDGRIKPDVMTPGTSFDCSYWNFEIDSIAIVYGSTKHVWNFGTGEPTWGVFLERKKIHYLKHESGKLSFTAANECILFSDSLSPLDTLRSNPRGTLVLRWKVTPGSNALNLQGFDMRLLWKRNTDRYCKYAWVNRENKPCFVNFKVNADGLWYDTRIPISDTTAITYQAEPWGRVVDVVNSLRMFISDTTVGLVLCKDDNTGYEYKVGPGCSISAPFCSGIVCLMLQKYRDVVLRSRNAATGRLTIHANPPWNSSMRGILIHTVIDMVDTVGISGFCYSPEFEAHGKTTRPVYGLGPDWATGWRFVDAEKAVKYVDTTRFRERKVNNRDSSVFYIYIPSGTDSVRTMLG